MCATNILAIYLCFSLPVAATAPQGLPEAYGHYQPARLNQAALERLRQGDGATARILLERAALLAPYEQSITANLDALQSYREAPLPVALRSQDADAPAPADAAPPPDAEDPVPPLWPQAVFQAVP